MPQREFDIVIGPDGNVELQVHGFKGKRCLDVMNLFKDIVGEVQSHRLTQDYYAPEEDVRINLERRQG